MRYLCLILLIVFCGCATSHKQIVIINPASVAINKNTAFIPPIPRHTNTYYTNGVMFSWEYKFAPVELTTFKFYGRTKIDGTSTLLGVNNKPTFNWYKTNGDIQFITCVAVDKDMQRDSTGQLK